MTIAMCYMSPEGVVLGADSTASATTEAGYHYLNHNQKLFELGENSTLGVLTWNLGGLTGKSYRTLLALLADSFEKHLPKSAEDVAKLWACQFWDAYIADPMIVRCRELATKSPFDAAKKDNPDPLARSEKEEIEFAAAKRNLVVGFCIAGYWKPERTPMGFQMTFDPLQGAPPTPAAIAMGSFSFYGAPRVIKRLIGGADDDLVDSILKSGKWNGTSDELAALLSRHVWFHPILPIRDAVDFVYTCIHSTIKALKFSNFSQICGGPIEIAVITTDRKFRWVRHKPWDAAITEGELE